MTMRIFSREGADPRMSGVFFKALVLVVLLFGAETWVVTPRMGRVMGRFYDQVVQRLTGQLQRWKTDSKW